MLTPQMLAYDLLDLAIVAARSTGLEPTQIDLQILQKSQFQPVLWSNPTCFF
jgi:hypothetical protein